MIKDLAYRSLAAPPVVTHCSQTIYESLLGCCRLWEATRQDVWRLRASSLVSILQVIQRPDGGFDIGYDFNFGRLHRKGQSTSPELVGLVALCEYRRLWGTESVAETAKRAAEWIRTHALHLQGGQVAIPYSPHTIREVMVYNGTSFACGALGCYLGRFEGDGEMRRIYEGMVAYLESVLSVDEARRGRFWYYNDQTRDDLDPLRRIKIDYYHQMQQVEVHALAQQAAPIERQRTIIRDAADHVCALHEEHGVVPYTNDDRFFAGLFHLWGLASVVPGMLEAAAVLPDRREAYHAVARETLEWIIERGWQGDRFVAVVDGDGAPVRRGSYMVRSDAWVFNALSAATRDLGEGPWTEVAERCYRTMEAADFSGPESHASTAKTRFVKRIWRAVKPLARR